MPNAVLIERLFGLSSSSEKIDVLIIDGTAANFSMDAEFEKLKAIQQQHNVFPNLYFYKVGESAFNKSFKEHFAAGTFTTLGLEAISKGALKKILSSLPKSVTTIGVHSLPAKAADYFNHTFLTRQKRKLSIVFGDTIGVEKVANSSNIQSANRKKRRSSTQHIILTSLAAHIRESAKIARVEPSTELLSSLYAEIAALKKTIETMQTAIQEAPLLNNALVMQLKLQADEQQIAVLKDRISQLSSENTWARTRLGQRESSTLSLRPELRLFNPLTMGSVMQSLEDDKHFSSPLFAYPGLLGTFPTTSRDNPFPLVAVTPPNDEQLRNACDILLMGPSSSSSTQSDPSMSQQQDSRNPYSIFSSPSSTPPTELLSRFPAPPRQEDEPSQSALSFLHNS